MGIIVSKVRGSLKNSSVKTRADYLRIQQNKHHKENNDPDEIAPQNTSQPTVSGSTAPTEEAQTSNGTWTSSEPVTYTYQWQLDGVDIAGATLSTIILLIGWVGSTVRCVVKATNIYGFTLAISTEIEVSL